MNVLETPAIIEKVTKIPMVNTNPNMASFNNQNENRNIKSKIAEKVKSRAFLGFTKFSSVPLNTSNGETYQVPNNGSNANNTDIKTPKVIPITNGCAVIEI